MRGEERQERAMLGLLPGPPCPPPPPHKNDLAGLPSCFFIEKFKLSLVLLDNFRQKKYAIYFLVFWHNKDRCQQSWISPAHCSNINCVLFWFYIKGDKKLTTKSYKI